ncbi:MAG: VIT and VWA domain-containing protein [Acidobacteria bacterium]|nr:VIT and VWA domain-containing protein [Acidobacteriota bacterium]
MKLSHLIIALSGLAFGAMVVEAQGIIIPRPCPRPIIHCPQPPQIPQQPLKVKSIHVSTKINDQVAITHVEQVFENNTPYTLEGIYFFPLPESVSITEFAMWDGNKRLVGEVRSRDEARRIYNDIVRTRRDPALLEYAGKNLFQASIFPISPNSEKKIELTYSQVLRNESGTVAYRYPLGTGWRANGFIAEPPGPIPMPRPRVEPENQIPRSPQNQSSTGRISAEVEIASRTAIKSVYSPTHEIEVKRDGERKARLSFEVRATSSQPDFQLFYTLSNQDISLSLLTHREPGKDGFFMLLVSPKAELDEREVSAKEVIFVLDTSGSMAEEGKMEKAKSALRFGVNSLDARDLFNIVSFAGEEHLLSERIIAANEEGKKQAREFIERMKATGGTNINDALVAAIKQLQASSRPQMVVLITDGQPTVGVTQAGKILNNIKEANKSNARLFTFGVGYDVNTILLDGLANENRGTVGYIEPNEDIELKVSGFFAKVNHPVLSDVKIDWGGLKTEMVYPRAVPDIFHGSQLILIGRYRSAVEQLTLSGQINGRERRFVYDDLRFPEKQHENEFLPHLWAMRRVGHLIDQIRLNGESKEMRDEIVELGTRYGIVTPYTSYLVLEPGMQTRMRRPGEGVPGQMTETIRVDNMGASGRSAFELSRKKEEMKDADKIVNERPSSSASKMRQITGKTFYLLDGVWTDSEFKEAARLPVVNLKFASDVYFNLIGQEPKLADYFALGKRVVVVWKGKVYRVDE